MALFRDSEARLVRQCREGQVRAFRRVVERYQRMVVAVAFSVTGDRALAEDVAQEAFLRAWHGMSELREPERLGAWLCGIARHLAHDDVRTRARRKTIAGTWDAEGDAAALEATPSTPLDQMVAREEEAFLVSALRALPEEYREPLVLFYFERRSVRQVAIGLGLSEETAKQRLSRGRRALRETLERRLASGLASLRPGKAFTAAVIATVSASRIGEAAAGAGKGTILMAMSGKQMAALVATVAALGTGTYAVFAARKEEKSIARTYDATGATAAQAAASTAVRPFPDRAARERMIQAIRAARERRIAASGVAALRSAQAHAEGPPAGPHAQPPPEPARATGEGELDKDYIRQAVRDLAPLLSECYSEGLERDPSMSGTVVVKFTIEGEPDIGGVVGLSQLDEHQSTIADATVRECVTQTMYGIEIDAPSHGGIINVTYPFSFHPSKEEE
jgi:RNA polymerase sigma factor (sigma-70 family)